MYGGTEFARRTRRFLSSRDVSSSFSSSTQLELAQSMTFVTLSQGYVLLNIGVE